MSPQVSICIPAYEEPDLLMRALNSVFEQTFTDFEVIVTDDSRSSGVQKVVQSWTRDLRFRYVRNVERLGSPENWNRAIALAQTNLIKVLHHDDWFTSKQSLLRYVSLLAEPSIAFAFSGAFARGSEGTLLYQHKATKEQVIALRKDPRCLIFGNVIGGPSATIFRRIPGFRFDPALKWLVDVDAYIRLLHRNNTFAFTEEPLVNTMARGPRQVTASVEADPSLQLRENAYVYNSLSLRGFDRIRGYGHFTVLARGVDAASIRRIHMENRRSAAELRMALLCERLKRKLQNGTKSAYRKARQLWEENWWVRWRQRRNALKAWRAAGRPAPPPHEIKEQVVRRYAADCGVNVLIESGTYLGEMVAAMQRHFTRIVSIELDPVLHKRASEKFFRVPHVEILQGDSGELMPRILSSLDAPALFWLDGHFSGGHTAMGKRETPIRQELEHILAHTELRHVILIDDARLFNGTHDYPTLADLEAFVRARRQRVRFEVEDDIIRIT